MNNKINIPENGSDLSRFTRNKEAVLKLLNTKPKEVRSSKKTLPDFIVIGAPKAGTTAIEQYLHQHPEIYMSPLKNPAFFIWEGRDRLFFGRNVVNNLTAYHALFQYHTSEKAIGEVSPGYLPDFSAPARMQAHLPHVKLIAVLRNPVERAFSQYWFNRQINTERISSFYDALILEKEIMAGRILEESQPKYIRGGFYHQHLTRYFEFFDRKQFKIILYDDFREKPKLVMEDIFRFLEVDPLFIPAVHEKHNVTIVPKIQWVDHIARNFARSSSVFLKKTGNKLRQHNQGKLPEIPEKIKALLLDVYTEDIKKLEILLERNLSSWFL